MKPDILAKIAVVVVLIAAIVAVVLMRNTQDKPTTTTTELAADTSGDAESKGPNLLLPDPDGPPLPRLLDLGRGTCIPCKMMTPVLEELSHDLAGQLEVMYINIEKDPEATAKYRVRGIPLQIFFDEDGSELFRHEGFFSRDDILKKWAELGYVLFPDEQPGEDASEGN